MPFGQVVVGPPGSGKTTYCHGMSQFLTGLDRHVAVINLDPANDILPYPCAVDISELITLADVMENVHLGPNGGLIYCMEFLEENFTWLIEKLRLLKDNYLLFDLPGQVELYTHHNSVRNILQLLEKEDYRLAAVHLVDSHYCSDPGKFVSVVLTSLSTMLHLSLPHVNVLSKADLIEKHGKLAFNLEYFLEVLDLNYLLDRLDDDPFYTKYKKLNAALVGVIEDYSLVSFVALNIQDKKSAWRVMQFVDKANGYVFGDLEDRNIQSMLSCAVGAEFQYEKIKDVQEKYIDISGDDEVGMDNNE